MKPVIIIAIAVICSVVAVLGVLAVYTISERIGEIKANQNQEHEERLAELERQRMCEVIDCELLRLPDTYEGVAAKLDQIERHYLGVDEKNNEP